MSNILIVNLKRHGDIYQSAHLIASLIEENKNTQISMLVFEEFKNSARTINHIQNIYTVPRKNIISFHKNDIYSDAFGLNELQQAMSAPLDEKWDMIINFSNDRASTYIASYIRTKSDAVIVGTSYDLNNNVKHSSQWATLYNEFSLLKMNSPFGVNDIVHLMSETKQRRRDDQIKTNPKHNQNAFVNFNQIRKSHQSEQDKITIIGLQLLTSDLSKNIPETTIIKMIELFDNNPQTVPLLIHSTSKTEKDYAKKINKHFDNRLICVESDLIALPSVLINIDLLITPDTMIKHLADCTDTPVIEVSLGTSPFFLQGSINPKSIIISLDPQIRLFSSTKKDLPRDDYFEKLPEIVYRSLLAIIQPEQETEFSAPYPWSVFKPIKDNIGTAYIPLTGSVEYGKEYTRFYSRIIADLIITGTDSTAKTLNTKPNKSLKRWGEQQKVDIANVSKTLLGCIRSLHQFKNDSKQISRFLDTLDELIECSQKEAITQIPLLLFKAKIESLPNFSKEDGLKEMNDILFKLKNDLQVVITTIAEITNQTIESHFESNEENWTTLT